MEPSLILMRPALLPHFTDVRAVRPKELNSQCLTGDIFIVSLVFRASDGQPGRGRLHAVTHSVETTFS